MTGYFDESAKGDDILVVAGFVSPADRWERFSEDCKAIEGEFGIPYIHSVELLQRRSSGVYARLSDSQRVTILQRFLGATLRSASLSIIVTISPKLFDSLSTKRWRDSYGSAYASCFQHIIGLLGTSLCDSSNVVTVDLYLEDGHRNAGGAEEVIRDFKRLTDDDPEMPVFREMTLPLKIGKYGRLKKADCPPLWAADLLAYSFLKSMTTGDKVARAILEVLDQSIPNTGLILSREKIEEMKDICAEAEERKRRWKEETHFLVKQVSPFGIKAERHPQGVAFDLSNMSDAQKKAFLGES